MPLPTTVLVGSSMNNGTPAVRSTIWSEISFGAPTLAIEAAGVISSAGQGEAAAIAEKGIGHAICLLNPREVAGAPEIMAQVGAERLPKLHAL